MAVKMEVWGNFACFSRPEMKVERVSYDVMTPRGECSRQYTGTQACSGILTTFMCWRLFR